MSIQIGSKAPEFTLYDTEKIERTLTNYFGKKVVLAFFPGAFTGVCTKEMCTFRDTVSDLTQLDAQIIAISIDSPFSNKAFSEINKLTFPILSDLNREVIKKYNAYHTEFAGIKGYVAAKRSVFILDKEGIIRYLWISENPGLEPNYDEIKQKLQSF